MITKEELIQERKTLTVSKSQYQLYLFRIDARIEEIDKELKK